MDHKKHTKITNYMLKWKGLGNLSVIDSIKKHGYAIRIKDTKSVVYECYLPDPEYDDHCVYLDGITFDYILDKLSNHRDFIRFLRETGISYPELRNQYGIDDLLKAIWDFFDIVDFFELGEIDAIPMEDVIEEISQSLETEGKEDSLPSIHIASYKATENVRILTWFDKLLRNRDLKECPPFLWQLKITDEEYKELKDYLHDKLLNEKDDSIFNREVALYIAEFHRREYHYEEHRNDDTCPSVFESLFKNEERDNSLQHKFISAMKSGAKKLNIHLYKSPRNGNTYYQYSLFYHGGLPLKKIVSNAENTSSWHRLIRKMLESDERIEFNEEFADLVNGVVANDSDSLKSFCQRLQEAIFWKDFKSLPFCCSSELDPIYLFFLNQGESVISEIKSRNPFQIQWRFDINRHRKVIKPKYNVSGPDSLSFDAEFFGENEQIKEKEAFSVITAEDGVERFHVTYHKTSCDFYREEVFNFEVPYKDVANITISCPELEKVLVSEELDIYSPQIMRKSEDGKYQLCSNRDIGHKEVVVIVPKGWSIENENKYTVEEGYSYLNEKARIVILPSGIEGQQLILKEDENGSKKVISATIPLTKVVAMNANMVTNLRQSGYFNVKDLYYSLKKPDTPLRRIRRDQLVFCSDRRTGKWTEEPPLGYIYVKPKDEEVYADPVKILNLGEKKDSFRIDYRDSNYDTCTIIVQWDDGTVKCSDGELIDNCWRFKKKDLADSRYVVFECNPNDGSKPFSVTIKTKFSDFQLFGPNGDKVQNNSYISLAQLSSYKYQIQNISLNMSIKVDGRLRFRCRTTDIVNNRVKMTVYDCDNKTQEEKTILAESGLDNLLGGMSNIMKMLYSSQKLIKDATISLTFSYNDKKFSCTIKKYPYTFRKHGVNEIRVYNKDRRVVYDGSIKALPLYNYENIQPVEIEPSDNGNFILSESVCAWDSLILLVSGKNECILPHAVNTKVDGELSKKEKDKRYSDVFLPMKENEYPNAQIWSDTWQRCCYWYETSLREHIPADSLFDLKVIMQDGKLLCRFVFNMLLKGLSPNIGNFSEYQEKLKRNLLDFSKSNHFLWVWIKKDDYSIKSLEPFIGQDLYHFEEFLQWWYFAQMDIENLKLLIENKTPTEDQLCTFLADEEGFMKKYVEFMDELRILSLAEFIAGNTLDKKAEDLLDNRTIQPLSEEEKEEIRDIASDSLTDLSDEDEVVFKSYTVQNEDRNFTRFCERANMFLSQMQGDEHTDIFSMKPVVRRSVLYYTSTFIDPFIKLWLSKISTNNIN